MAELRLLAVEARRKRAIENKEAKQNMKSKVKMIKEIKKPIEMEEEPLRELDLELPNDIKEIIEE